MRSLLAFLLTLSLCQPTMGKPLLKANALTVICLGESLTSGSQSTGGVGGEGSTNSYPAVLAARRGLTYDQQVINMGVGGIGIDTLPDPSPFYRRSRDVLVVLQEGINNFFSEVTPADATDIFDKLQTKVDTIRGQGVRVLVCTLTKVGLSNPAAQTERTAYNTLIRNAYDGGAVDGVTMCDLAADSRIGDSAVIDGTYFAGDSYHLNNAGYAVMAEIIDGVLETSSNRPSVVVADGTEVMALPHLTGWFTPDWSQRNTSSDEMFVMMNLAARRTFTRYLPENNQDAGGGHAQVTRVDNVLNGNPAARFPGNQDSGNDKTAYMQSSTTLASFVSASSFFYAAVVNPTAIASTNANAHFNEIVLGVSGGFGCGLGFRDSGGTKQVIAYVDDGAKKVAAATAPSVGSPVAIFARLTGGKVGVRVGTQGSWVETASGDIADLTGALKIGASSLDCFYGDMFVGQTFSEYSLTADAVVSAYFRAKFGGSL